MREKGTPREERRYNRECAARAIKAASGI
jgi:hypothetical protein